MSIQLPLSTTLPSSPPKPKAPSKLKSPQVFRRSLFLPGSPLLHDNASLERSIQILGSEKISVSNVQIFTLTFAEGLDAAGATGAGVLGAVGHGAAVGQGAPALHCLIDWAWMK